MAPGLPQLWRWNVPYGPCSVFGLVMASDIVPATIASPDGNRLKIASMRIDFAAAGEPGLNFSGTSAAIELG